MYYSNRKILVLTFVFTLGAGFGPLKLASAQDVAVGEQTSRVLHFPEDRSLGRLSKLIHLEPWVLDNTNPPDVWEFIGEAQGEVTVPRDARIQLEVHKTALRDLSPLARLRPNDLYRLDIICSINDDNNPDRTIMPHLRNLTGLEVLSFYFANISYQGLRYIKDFKSLKQLELRFDSKTDNTSFEMLGNIKSLEALRVHTGSFNDQGLQHLIKLPQLRELSLSVDYIRGPGLAHLEKIPSLRHLELVGSNFGNSGMQYLKNLTSLKKLMLFGDLRITDAGLAPLANLTGLEELRTTWISGITGQRISCGNSQRSIGQITLEGNSHKSTGGIQTTDPKIVEQYNLKKLKLGDIVAIRDHLDVFGRGRYLGALTIGVVIHGWSDYAGHGPGVNPILSALPGKIKTTTDPDANIAYYLGIKPKPKK